MGSLIISSESINSLQISCSSSLNSSSVFQVMSSVCLPVDVVKSQITSSPSFVGENVSFLLVFVMGSPFLQPLLISSSTSRSVDMVSFSISPYPFFV